MTAGSEAEIAVASSGAATVLSMLFWSPVPLGRIESWRDDGALEFLGEYLSVLGSEASGAVDMLREAVSAQPALDVERHLNVDATALFRVGVNDVPASPYGSVWLEPERLLMGTTTRGVAAEYREYGVMAADDSTDFVPDHVSRELEYLALLFRRQALALDIGDQDGAAQLEMRALSFFERYCRPWWPEFCAAVGAHARQLFYRASADLLLAYTKSLAERTDAHAAGSAVSPD